MGREDVSDTVVMSGTWGTWGQCGGHGGHVGDTGDAGGMQGMQGRQTDGGNGGLNRAGSQWGTNWDHLARLRSRVK